MDGQHLIDVRKRLGFSQELMGHALGMSRRGIMDLENGVSQVREIHRLAIESLTLREAVSRGDLNIAEPAIRGYALDYAQLARGGRE